MHDVCEMERRSNYLVIKEILQNWKCTSCANAALCHWISEEDSGSWFRRLRSGFVLKTRDPMFKHPISVERWMRAKNILRWEVSSGSWKPEMNANAVFAFGSAKKSKICFVTGLGAFFPSGFHALLSEWGALWKGFWIRTCKIFLAWKSLACEMFTREPILDPSQPDKLNGRALRMKL